MTAMPAEAATAGKAPSRSGATACAESPRTYFLLMALAAFGLYWFSAVILEARGGTTHFGADAHLYAPLAEGIAHDRVTRFHPLTTAMAAVWLKVLGPLTPWITPQYLLKAMFAAVGAVGVWAAMRAFAAVVPRRYAMPLGAIYATSLGIWFFSSIEESKIVSATLVALYIASYLRLRKSWTVRGAVLLTAILLLACLNEIVAGFLVVIPAVDTLVQRGWDLRYGWWIGWHALAAPLALVFLEVVVNGRLVAAGTEAEGASHISMLIFYVTQNDYSPENLLNFASRWLFFNFAAPALDAAYAADPENDYAGDFDATLANYFSSPVSIGLVVLFGAMLVATVLARRPANGSANLTGVFPALAAYALLRGAFFLIFSPGECLLFSSSVTLAHMLLIGIPFAASSLPAKRGLLAALAMLLFIVNGSFIIGQ